MRYSKSCLLRFLRPYLFTSILLTAFLLAFPFLRAKTSPAPSQYASFPLLAGHNDTGKVNLLEWKFRTQGRIIGSPVVSKGAVYFASEDQNIYALSAQSGALLWRYKMKGPAFNSLALSKGILLCGSTDGNLYALHSKTGKLIWRFSAKGEIWSAPVCAKNLVLIGSNDNQLYALRLQTGAIVWSFKTQGWVRATATVDKNKVYIGNSGQETNYHLYALSLSEGKLLWSFPVKGPVEAGAAISKNLVFWGCEDGFCYALDKNTGKFAWKRKLDNAAWLSAAPLPESNSIYIAAGNGTVYKLLAADGLILWRYKAEGWFNASPISYQNSIIVSSGGLHNNNYIYGIRKQDGSLLWRIRINAEVEKAAALSGKILYVGCHDGYLYAIRLPPKEGTFFLAAP
jgi:outer membrane protein assembly factor BamB